MFEYTIDWSAVLDFLNKNWFSIISSAIVAIWNIWITLWNHKSELKLLNYKQKLGFYQEIALPISEIIHKMTDILVGEPDDPNTLHDVWRTTALENLSKKFYPERIQLFTKMALFASKEAYSEFQNLINYIFGILDEEISWDYKDLDARATKVLNAIRADLGIKTQIDVTSDFQ